MAEEDQPKKRKRGRPEGSGVRIEIDTKLIEALAAIGCTPGEIAQELTKLGTKVSARTIRRRLEFDEDKKAAYDKGEGHAKVTLRKRMWLQAQMMNGAGVAMSIFLAKNWLGMSDHREPFISNKVEVFNNQVVGQTSRDRIAARLDRLAERIGSRIIEIEHKPSITTETTETKASEAPTVSFTPVVAEGGESPPPTHDRPSAADIFRAIKEAMPA
jgi:hypothetical protein